MNNKVEVNEITPQAKASFKSRVIVAAIMLVIIIPAFVLGGWVFFIAMAVFLALATYEMITATGKKYPWYLWVCTYLIVFSFTYWFVIKGNFAAYLAYKNALKLDPSTTATFHFSLEEHFQNLDVSVLGIGAALGMYFLMGICGHDVSFDDVAYFITFSLILGLGFQAAFFIRYYPFYLFGHNPSFAGNQAMLGYTGNELIKTNIFKYLISTELLVFVFLGVTMNDTFAYVFGSLFGKHKLNEKVSPHKTWEGFFGGWAVGTVSCLAFSLPLTLCGYPMIPTITAETWYWLIPLSILIPLFGNLGDLSFSFIKRRYGIKDYGNILKGHGGIIDRVGSDLFACLGVAIMLIFLTNGWNLFA